MRTFAIDIIERATKSYKEEIEGFDPQEWIKNNKNVALTNDTGDVALLEHEYPGVVTGHYFFHSRGGKALKAAKEFLQEAFEGSYDIKAIRGLTPVEHLGALWMNRRLGFTPYGTIDTVAGSCELVILTKKEWETMNG